MAEKDGGGRGGGLDLTKLGLIAGTKMYMRNGAGTDDKKGNKALTANGKKHIPLNVFTCFKT